MPSNTHWYLEHGPLDWPPFPEPRLNCGQMQRRSLGQFAQAELLTTENVLAVLFALWFLMWIGVHG